MRNACNNHSMGINTILRVIAIFLPLLAAFFIWRLGDKIHQSKHRLAVFVFGLNAIIALILFIFTTQYTCVFQSGRKSCLLEATGTISFLLLNLFMSKVCLTRTRESDSEELILMLLLSSAWADVGLADNLFVLLLALYLFVFVFNRWLKRIGFKGGFLKIRNDDEEDPRID